MEKIDVAIQSYKKPESMIYTLFSLKKYCGDLIDTVYINDDCSRDGTLEYYNERLKNALSPLKIKIRENDAPSGYNITLMTKEAMRKKTILEKIRLIMYIPIKRLEFHNSDNDIRYQWAINQTDKEYIFLIHDDIKFFNNIAQVYFDILEENSNLAIVGDMGYCSVCPYGPCGKMCSPKKILEGVLPSKKWPITGCDSIIHKILGRYRRNCRINEWCCMVRTRVARELVEEKGLYFGNYEAGGDVGSYWFSEIIKRGYDFTDPFPSPEERLHYYLHWWQGHEGHEVWVDYGRGKQQYQREYIKDCVKKEFGYEINIV